jgi:hypothetical protein
MRNSWNANARERALRPIPGLELGAEFFLFFLAPRTTNEVFDREVGLFSIFGQSTPFFSDLNLLPCFTPPWLLPPTLLMMYAISDPSFHF